MTTEINDNANTAHALQNTERVVSGHNNESWEAMLRYAKDAHKRTTKVVGYAPDLAEWVLRAGAGETSGQTPNEASPVRPGRERK
ncbi:MAG: hypothetical protein HRU33_18380 [Rhodobacteraceae bacterium]|nr:hypothetical protein [Paracoccaceae bacterium]